MQAVSSKILELAPGDPMVYDEYGSRGGPRFYDDAVVVRRVPGGTFDIDVIYRYQGKGSFVRVPCGR